MTEGTGPLTLVYDVIAYDDVSSFSWSHNGSAITSDGSSNRSRRSLPEFSTAVNEVGRIWKQVNKQSILTATKVKKEMAGIYKVMAKNRIGNLSGEVQVIIRCKFI